MTDLGERIRRHYGVIYILVLLNAMIFYVVLSLGVRHVWADEAFSFGMTRLGFDEMWRLPNVDVHPLLYYFYLKCFQSVFGTSVPVARMASVLPYMMILAFGGRQLRKLFDEETSLAFMVLFFFFPFLMTYSVEVRMYSLAAAFVFFNAIFAYRCYLEERKNNWLLLALFSTGAAYTHYYAFVSIIVTDLLLLIFLVRERSGKVKWFLFSFLGMVLMYLPWIPHCLQQLVYKAGHEYWISEITLGTLLGYVMSVFKVKGGGLAGIVILALCYLVALIAILRLKDPRLIRMELCLLAVPILTALTGIVISFLVRPVFVIRYIVPSLPLMILFMAIAVTKIRARRLAAVLFGFSLICGVINAGTLIREKYQAQPDNELDEAWLSQIPPADAFVVLNESDHIATVLAYYEQERPIYARNIMSGEASPFRNLGKLEEYDGSSWETTIFFANPGESVPEQFTAGKTVEYLGRVDEMGKRMDAYSITGIDEE